MGAGNSTNAGKDALKSAEALFSGSRGGKAHPEAFHGVEAIAPPQSLETWLRRANAGDEFIYCEARAPIRTETWYRAGELARDGLIRTHERKRAGGGKVYFAVRTRKVLPSAKDDPVATALADPITDTIFRALKRAANMAQACPTDSELMRMTGLDQRQQAGWRVRRLVKVGLIKSMQVYESHVPARVVEILPTKHAGAAGGKCTAFPKKWRDLREAAERELRQADNADISRLRRAGL